MRDIDTPENRIAVTVAVAAVTGFALGFICGSAL